MYLPDTIAETIFTAVNAQYSEEQGAAFVDCALRYAEGSIDFTFTGPTISVKLDELVIVAGIDRGEPVCILGIAPAGSSTPVLGDTFLRSAYVVYDLQHNEISLAPTNFNVTSSDDDVLEITNSTSNPIPSATVVPNAVTSIAVTPGGHVNGGEPDSINFASTTTAEAFAVQTAYSGYSAALIGAVGVAVLAL